MIVECKSTTPTNETKQLRLGLGQLLDYADHIAMANRRVRPVLAVEDQPKSDHWIKLCKKHGVKLVWPGTFHTIFR